MRVLAEWQALRCMEMHWCCDGDVGDSDLVASKPLCLGELGVEDAGELVPSWGLTVNDRLIGLGLEKRFHDIFHEIGVAALKPD